MTNLLLRLFVPNASENTPAAHGAVGKLAGITGIVCNVLLASLKILAGLITGSVAITGDGINNLTDSASSIVTLLGFRIAQRRTESTLSATAGMSTSPAWWWPRWCCWRGRSWPNPLWIKSSAPRLCLSLP